MAYCYMAFVSDLGRSLKATPIGENFYRYMGAHD